MINTSYKALESHRLGTKRKKMVDNPSPQYDALHRPLCMSRENKERKATWPVNLHNYKNSFFSPDKNQRGIRTKQKENLESTPSQMSLLSLWWPELGQ